MNSEFTIKKLQVGKGKKPQLSYQLDNVDSKFTDKTFACGGGRRIKNKWVEPRAKIAAEMDTDFLILS